MADTYQRLLAKYDRIKQMKSTAKEKEPPCPPKKFKLKPDVHTPEMVARQLTLICAEYVNNVPLRQFLHKAWEQKPGTEHKIKELAELVNRANLVSFWTASVILISPEGQRRQKMISFMIRVSTACIGLQNYQTAMQIYLGLNMAPLIPLKEWKGLGKKTKGQLFDLNSFFSSSNSFTRYRKKLKETSAPGIPLISLILSDLAMIEESKDYLSGQLVVPNEESEREQEGEFNVGEGDTQLIHFAKMTLIYDTLKSLALSTNFSDLKDLASDDPPDLTLYLTKLPSLTESTLYGIDKSQLKRSKRKQLITKLSVT